MHAPAVAQTTAGRGRAGRRSNSSAHGGARTSLVLTSGARGRRAGGEEGGDNDEQEDEQEDEHEHVEKDDGGTAPSIVYDAASGRKVLHCMIFLVLTFAVEDVTNSEDSDEEVESEVTTDDVRQFMLVLCAADRTSIHHPKRRVIASAASSVMSGLRRVTRGWSLEQEIDLKNMFAPGLGAACSEERKTIRSLFKAVYDAREENSAACSTWPSTEELHTESKRGKRTSHPILKFAVEAGRQLDEPATRRTMSRALRDIIVRSNSQASQALGTARAVAGKEGARKDVLALQEVAQGQAAAHLAQCLRAYLQPLTAAAASAAGAGRSRDELQSLATAPTHLVDWAVKERHELFVNLLLGRDKEALRRLRLVLLDARRALGEDDFQRLIYEPMVAATMPDSISMDELLRELPAEPAAEEAAEVGGTTAGAEAAAEDASAEAAAEGDAATDVGAAAADGDELDSMDGGEAAAAGDGSEQASFASNELASMNGGEAAADTDRSEQASFASNDEGAPSEAVAAAGSPLTAAISGAAASLAAQAAGGSSQAQAPSLPAAQAPIVGGASKRECASAASPAATTNASRRRLGVHLMPSLGSASRASLGRTQGAHLPSMHELEAQRLGVPLMPSLGSASRASQENAEQVREQRREQAPIALGRTQGAHLRSMLQLTLDAAQRQHDGAQQLYVAAQRQRDASQQIYAAAQEQFDAAQEQCVAAQQQCVAAIVELLAEVLECEATTVAIIETANSMGFPWDPHRSMNAQVQAFYAWFLRMQGPSVQQRR